MTSAKHTVRTITLAAATMAVTVLTGCTPLSPVVDSQFGNALNTLKTQQTFDVTAAVRNDSPLQDGKAAAEATSRYVKSFNAPTPHQNVFTIGVGGGTR